MEILVRVLLELFASAEFWSGVLIGLVLAFGLDHVLFPRLARVWVRRHRVTRGR